MSDNNQTDLENAVEQIVEESLEEKLTEDVSIWKKAQTSIMMVAALMISAGQFNDTKDLVTSLYDATLTHFTHTIEYETLQNIHVGNSIDYVKTFVGEPHVIKRSKLIPTLQYHYYSKNKYHLTLFSQDERLVGYSVFISQDGFTPDIPFSEQLGTQTIFQAHNITGAYSFDIGNLLYYIESQDLGKQQMFLTLFRGYVEYGANANVDINNQETNKKIANALERLNEKATLAENAEELIAPLKSVRQNIYPNFYAITELEPKIVAEALFTRYEYQLFTKS